MHVVSCIGSSHYNGNLGIGIIEDSEVQAAEFEAECFCWMFLLLFSVKRFSCFMDEDRRVTWMLQSYVLLLPCIQNYTGDSKVTNQIGLLQKYKLFLR